MGSNDNIKITPIQKRTSGVYFLFKGDELLYVGQTKKVLARVFAHQTLDYDGYAFLEYHDSILDVAEAEYISKLNPRFNRQARAGALTMLSLRSKIKRENKGLRISIRKIKEIADSCGFKYGIVFKLDTFFSGSEYDIVLQKTKAFYAK